MTQFEFAGSRYDTINAAARAWAITALPDPNVIGARENPATAAYELEAHWWAEAQKIGKGAPDGVRDEVWRACCRTELVQRILDSRG